MNEIPKNQGTDQDDEFVEFMKESLWSYDGKMECWKRIHPDNFGVEIVERHGCFQPIVPNVNGLPDYNIGVFRTLVEAKIAAWRKHKEVVQVIYDRTEAKQDFG